MKKCVGKAVTAEGTVFMTEPKPRKGPGSSYFTHYRKEENRIYSCTTWIDAEGAFTSPWCRIQCDEETVMKNLGIDSWN